MLIFFLCSIICFLHCCSYSCLLLSDVTCAQLMRDLNLERSTWELIYVLYSDRVKVETMDDDWDMEPSIITHTVRGVARGVVQGDRKAHYHYAYCVGCGKEWGMRGREIKPCIVAHTERQKQNVW